MPDVEVRDVALTPEGVGSHAEWSWKLAGPLFVRGRIEVTEFVPDERIVVTSSTGPVFTFTLAPHDSGTEVGVVVDWSFETPVVGAPLEGLTARMTRADMAEFLVNLKAAAEGVGPEAGPPVTQPKTGGKLTRSVLIGAPVDRVFADVLDLGTFWAGAPGVATRAVRRAPGGVGTSTQIYSSFLGLHMQGSVEIVEVVPDERIGMKADFGPERPTWTFTFEPAAGGTTLVGEGEWRMNLPAVGRRLEAVAAMMHESFLEGMLASAKERLEAAGAGTEGPLPGR